jgi:hypothetical protein
MTVYQRGATGTWTAVVPSPDGTVIKVGSGVITDLNGAKWTLPASMIVNVNGVPDLTTWAVTELAYSGGVISQFNGINWYSKVLASWVTGEDATLTWNPPTTNTNGTPITALSGYIVSYGTSPTALTNKVSVIAPASTVVIPGLTTGPWYFAIAAVNSYNISSAESNTVSKVIT